MAVATCIDAQQAPRALADEVAAIRQEGEPPGWRSSPATGVRVSARTGSTRQTSSRANSRNMGASSLGQT
ncbi:hypothetical protein KAM358_09780 [Aeromonas caviae]|nr:hypothetical protein [Aeromonas caviae]GJA93146.1 hypothetical protein KAM358_09780 [Aeromonas caviae]